MPATPAWPPRSAPRLFVEQELSEGTEVALDGPAAHYLLKVMRLSEGAPLTLFDDRTGDYAATVTQAGKRDLIVRADERLRPREDVPDLWLCAAPIKRQRFDWVAEKASELGVRRFQPVATARAVVDKVKDDRVRAHMIEAAEQCERNALPELGELTPLSILLADWPEDRYLFFCDERGGGSFRSALRAHDGPAAILIGPEGGFTDDENAAIRACPQAVPVSLGPRILRADTAAVAAVSLWMAGRGDWG
ncbi:16S rRNA (uracil(1498)-N(3))-methyltransferase [Novosphingopyxis sp. YJ-S2-01]|uniref:16S rRNA (uracil(1498)-N(3))-methyltransferase n=1 Tax=Novosphingopyxis sp. YJ-S2-01 TaxID=2794021 RepID=UPI0018DDFED6|nr:16S rRNA (uracil(1498)-N(3))-methyltransferase [Novosphingopyxis sp. YJ-S2-01]MBH9537088.1 16S rRNA (uracil(1498)-N(3))-methyltransferase [Novosphingopyxis sp. YJ-S2-01]